MFSWLSKKSKNQEYLDILGDYDPTDPRVDELMTIYSSIKRRIDYAHSIMLQLEGTSSHDMMGDETAKVKELVVKCYAELERLSLDGDPAESLASRHEHVVFSKSAALIIPVLVRLGAHKDAKDLFAEIKMEQIRDELLFRHWQLRIPQEGSSR
jgi:hypothetical protein